MANALRRLGMVLGTVLERLLRFVIAIPINVVTIPLGVLLFALGTFVSYIAYDAGSDIRMTGIETLAWGWDWWPAEVDVDWKV